MPKNLNTSLAEDHYYIWHPYTQAKLTPTRFLVKSAEKEFILVEDEEGKQFKLIDGISSWWVNIHGHSNQYITDKIKEQLDKHQQVIFAGLSHEPAIQLVQQLIPILPKADLMTKSPRIKNLDKVFFSDNGSTAVEVALKMALQYFYNNGESQKKRFIAFRDSYHGDTIGAMSVGTDSIFNQAFKSILFPVDFVNSPSMLPVGDRSKEELKEMAEDRVIEQILKLLNNNPNEYAGIIIEPLVQAASGMRFHRAQFLQRLRNLCNHYGLILIADEVFTGFGRTGQDFACKQATIVPDIICLSKALTGGFLPLGLTITSQEIYSAFHDESRYKTFFHGHSYTANSLACTAALASLELYQKENRLEDVKFINLKMKHFLKDSILESLPYIKEVRILGAIAAIEFESKDKTGYLSDWGPYLHEEFLRRQILLRPLGNVLYFLPPYTISVEALDYTLNSILEVCSSFA